ncbi:hypothetical protein J8273_5491 [Carpediemonas membranifera]|uniref:Uncharacterized protein n=1 Tax=Carpediemonas membranifera TaxID=201153 RepID=A0A8J6BWJ2_9EUKA|nr:hypothetical protein J8273_5491 [Carpediemonas membranifera]|eukprot:KAG9392496.1 hypothetical protein J8273_5491 [Carpediemonas membranifera]
MADNPVEDLTRKFEQQESLIRALTARISEQENEREDLRAPSRLDGIKKEYLAWKHFYADFKVEVKATEKPSVKGIMDIAGNMVEKRLQYLRTIDTYGEEVGAVWWS